MPEKTYGYMVSAEMVRRVRQDWQRASAAKTEHLLKLPLDARMLIPPRVTRRLTEADRLRILRSLVDDGRRDALTRLARAAASVTDTAGTAYAWLSGCVAAVLAHPVGGVGCIARRTTTMKKVPPVASGRQRKR